MNPEEWYRDREQTLIKHFILQKYLERFAHIVLSRWESITYVDGFSGPWESQSEDLEDTSFSIALRELRRAQMTHSQKRRQTRLRCFFIEKHNEPFLRLEDYVAKVRGRDEIRIERSTFSDAIPKIVSFIKEDPKTFPFNFIDPTGWTGFEIRTIQSLLRLTPGEVLINFMTGHILRFWTSPDAPTQKSIEEMYDDPTIVERLTHLPSEHREDAAVANYCEAIRRAGQFEYVCRAVILQPTTNKTHFHLIYATRGFRGLEVFKEIEHAAMALQMRTRAESRHRREVERTGQLSLLKAEALDDPDYVDDLVDRYLFSAKTKLIQLLRIKQRITYRRIKENVLTEPIVQDRSLKEWLLGWVESQAIIVEGMNPRQRVPYDENVILVKDPHLLR